MLIHPSADGHVGCFQFGDIMNHAATDIHVQVFVWTDVLILWMRYLAGELLDQMVTLCLTF